MPLQALEGAWEPSRSRYTISQVLPSQAQGPTAPALAVVSTAELSLSSLH